MPKPRRRAKRAPARILPRARDRLRAGFRRAPSRCDPRTRAACDGSDPVVGFLNPNNLLWALSLAVLFAIYLRSRSRPTVEVSSLLLFDEAPAPSANVRNL